MAQVPTDDRNAEQSKVTVSVSPAPHLTDRALTTRRMMLDVLIALAPVVGVSVYVFRWYAVLQLGICIVSCLVAEAIYTAMRRRPVTLGDLSAVVTGAILALSLPGTAPWYVGAIGSFAAVGIGKVVFGGLGQNIFNPAMVGRAFVMIAFPAALGASGYVLESSAVEAITQATPLTAAKQLGQTTSLSALFLGTTNGSLGETSAIACLIGGLYLCIRGTGSWQIPAGIIITAGVLFGVADWVDPQDWTMLHHLLGGALLFGAFFIATDPVSSPLTAKGKWIFAVGVGALVVLMRIFSGYPEGVMFSVLLMNAIVPLINRWTVPRPVGGPVPVRKKA